MNIEKKLSVRCCEYLFQILGFTVCEDNAKGITSYLKQEELMLVLLFVTKNKWL